MFNLKANGILHWTTLHKAMTITNLGVRVLFHSGQNLFSELIEKNFSVLCKGFAFPNFAPIAEKIAEFAGQINFLLVGPLYFAFANLNALE